MREIENASERCALGSAISGTAILPIHFRLPPILIHLPPIRLLLPPIRLLLLPIRLMPQSQCRSSQSTQSATPPALSTDHLHARIAFSSVEEAVIKAVHPNLDNSTSSVLPRNTTIHPVTRRPCEHVTTQGLPERLHATVDPPPGHGSFPPSLTFSHLLQNRRPSSATHHPLSLKISAPPAMFPPFVVCFVQIIAALCSACWFLSWCESEEDKANTNFKYLTKKFQAIISRSRNLAIYLGGSRLEGNRRL